MTEIEELSNNLQFHFGRCNYKFTGLMKCDYEKIIDELNSDITIRKVFMIYLMDMMINQHLLSNSYITETKESIKNDEYWFEFSEKLTIDKSEDPKTRFEKVKPFLNSMRVYEKY